MFCSCKAGYYALGMFLLWRCPSSRSIQEIYIQRQQQQQQLLQQEFEDEAERSMDFGVDDFSKPDEDLAEGKGLGFRV